MSRDDLAALQDRISRVLTIGLRTVAVVLVSGLVLWVARWHLAAIVLTIGLVLLMLIPVVRIATSFVDAVQRRDRLLSWSTAAVLLIMLGTVAYSFVAR